jgi:hypothetical protein
VRAINQVQKPLIPVQFGRTGLDRCRQVGQRHAIVPQLRLCFGQLLPGRGQLVLGEQGAGRVERIAHLALAGPLLRRTPAHQPQVRLMHQGRRLEGLTGLLLGQLGRRQLAQLVVDQRQELLGGVWVAVLDGIQQVADIGQKRRE